MLIQLRSHVLADPSVDAFVHGRMYPEILPQTPGILPAISFQVVSESRRATMLARDSLPRIRVQMDCWADDTIEAHALGNAVLIALDGFSGMIGAVVPVFAAIFASSSFSDYESVTKMYRVSRDYLVWTRE